MFFNTQQIVHISWRVFLSHKNAHQKPATQYASVLSAFLHGYSSNCCYSSIINSKVHPVCQKFHKCGCVGDLPLYTSILFPLSNLDLASSINASPRLSSCLIKPKQAIIIIINKQYLYCTSLKLHKSSQRYEEETTVPY